MKLIPGPKRILAEYIEGKEQSVGGIYIPEEAQQKEIIEAEVVGAERFRDDDYKFEPGDNIIFMRSGAVEVEIRNTKYFLVHEDNIIAVISFPKIRDESE
jgi:co-chaperonin GroES (HSP10)